MALLGAYMSFFGYEPASERNTIQLSATITNISPVAFYSLESQEYNAELFLFWEKTVINMDALNNLTVGQTITFSIKKSEESLLSSSKERIELVALSQGSTDIVTFESYNNHTKKIRTESTICLSLVGIIFSVTAILYLLWHKGIIFSKHFTKELVQHIFYEDNNKRRNFIFTFMLSFYTAGTVGLTVFSTAMLHKFAFLDFLLYCLVPVLALLMIGFLFNVFLLKSKKLKYFLAIDNNEITTFFSIGEKISYKSTDIKSYEVIQSDGQLTNIQLEFSENKKISIVTRKFTELKNVLDLLILRKEK